MKRLQIKIVAYLILGSVILINCSNKKNQYIVNGSQKKNQKVDRVMLINLDTIYFTHSMKGWELYSWPNGNDWNYSVLKGSNRLKSYEEVIVNKIIVFGKDSLKWLLDKFPAKEEIFWIGEEWLDKTGGGNFGNLSLPDNNTINEIKNYCSQKELILGISN